MSTITLSKLASISTPAANKGRAYFDSARLAFCFVDENGAQWWFGQQRARLIADMSGTTSATPADVVGLGFPLLANARYAFEFGLVWRSTDITTSLKIGLTTPLTPTIFAANVRIPLATDGSGAAFQGTLKGGDTVTCTGQEEANVDYVADIRGVIVNGANPGNLQLQWAAEVGAAGTVTPRQGSWGKLWLT